MRLERRYVRHGGGEFSRRLFHVISISFARLGHGADLDTVLGVGFQAGELSAVELGVDHLFALLERTAVVDHFLMKETVAFIVFIILKISAKEVSYVRASLHGYRSLGSTPSFFLTL